MLLVATWVAPKFLSIQILPVVGFVTSSTVVAPAQCTVPAGYWPMKAPTLTVKEHDCPPTVMAKVAVPLVVGVPVIVYVNEPAPLASVPAERVAVKPTTPVELIVCALYVPAFPPV